MSIKDEPLVFTWAALLMNKKAIGMMINFLKKDMFKYRANSVLHQPETDHVKIVALVIYK